MSEEIILEARDIWHLKKKKKKKKKKSKKGE